MKKAKRWNKQTNKQKAAGRGAHLAKKPGGGEKETELKQHICLPL